MANGREGCDFQSMSPRDGLARYVSQRLCLEGGERAREVHYDGVTKEEEASQCLPEGLNIRCGCLRPCS